MSSPPQMLPRPMRSLAQVRDLLANRGEILQTWDCGFYRLRFVRMRPYHWTTQYIQEVEKRAFKKLRQLEATQELYREVQA